MSEPAVDGLRKILAEYFTGDALKQISILLDTLEERLEVANNGIDDINAARKRRSALDTKISELGVCPTCGQILPRQQPPPGAQN